MSAETVPAEVGMLASAAASKFISIDDGDHPELRNIIAAAIMNALADRTTRPPEPSLPEAEAGESEAVAYLIKSKIGNDTVFWRSRDVRDAMPDEAWFVPASTLAAECAAHEETRRERNEARSSYSQKSAECYDAVRDRDALREACIGFRARAEAAEAHARSLEERLATAGEDERDRLFAAIHTPTPTIIDGRDENWRDVTGFWLEDQGAMPPSARAWLRTLPPQPGVTHGDASQDGGADHG